MKPFETDANKYDKDFTSINSKLSLSAEEQKDILFQIQSKLDNKKTWRKSVFSLRPYMALAAAFLVIMVLAFPTIQARTGLSLFDKSMTPEDVVEAYYAAYNDKDYKTYHSFGSNRMEEEFEKMKTEQELTDEALQKSWLRTWVPAEVIQIKDHGGTSKKTTVVAIVHYPSTLLSPEATNMITYELVKEDGDWKIDEIIDYRGL
jgi:hypothetical protein